MRLSNWIEECVDPIKDQVLCQASGEHFFRDPNRPTYSSLDYFLSPADGVIIYQKEVDPDEAVCEVKGINYTLSDLLRQELDRRFYVVGIFMTYYDVHVNRVPYPGRLSYKMLDPISTKNQPMLDFETNLIKHRKIDGVGDYLYLNERCVNTVRSRQLGDSYYILQIADYDVDTIVPFEITQNEPVVQGTRFSMIRYGSQVDLVIPVSNRYELSSIHEVSDHVVASEPLLKIDYV